MGDRQEELEASCKLILHYAREACPEGADLRPDVEYGASLVLAAPDLLEACEAVLKSFGDMKVRLAEMSERETNRFEALLRVNAAIARAKGENP